MDKNKSTLSLLIFTAIALFLAGCENNPIKRLIDPTVSNATGQWSDLWTLYDDEIKTGGGVDTFTTMNGVELDFASADHPYSGNRCIRFAWNGGNVTAYEGNRVQHDFVGFALTVGDRADPTKPTSKDFTTAGYTKISFRARGSLNTNVYLRLEANNGNYQTPSGINAWLSNATDRKITSDWQQYEFNLAGSLANTQNFVKIILLYDEDGNPDIPNAGQGSGGTVFIDDIKMFQQ